MKLGLAVVIVLLMISLNQAQIAVGPRYFRQLVSSKTWFLDSSIRLCICAACIYFPIYKCSLYTTCLLLLAEIKLR